MFNIKSIVTDTKKLGLRTTTTNLAITQAIMHEAIYTKRKMKAYDDNIFLLESQVDCYKYTKYEIFTFIDYTFRIHNDLNVV
jgi:hypothetical protein